LEGIWLDEGPVLKTGGCKSFGGSSPSPSAKKEVIMTLDEWKEEVRRILIREYSYDRLAVERLTLESFERYFEEGLDPEEAIFEDIHGE